MNKKRQDVHEEGEEDPDHRHLLQEEVVEVLLLLWGEISQRQHVLNVLLDVNKPQTLCELLDVVQQRD